MNATVNKPNALNLDAPPGGGQSPQGTPAGEARVPGGIRPAPGVTRADREDENCVSEIRPHASAKAGF